MKIVTHPAPILREEAEPVNPRSGTDHLVVGADLLIALDMLPDALAVAAQQIGSKLRMFAYRERDGEMNVLVNPTIVEVRGRRLGKERCLSFPGRIFQVVRPQAVVVHAKTIEGDDVRLCWHDLYARMAAHEIDHLDGLLVIDRLPGAKRG